ncbi:unnamed protein product [Enterobius vermicularis]|uniref:Na_Ca_ex domain-containing protein n=1 Tax=Enterobius vermicularis TaxID=51028 RepID=A0A0N4VE26_ENTVE|nr:unnamed protein product [Enterobius vermicularis]
MNGCSMQVLFALAGFELFSIVTLFFLYACNGAWRNSESRWIAGLSQKYQVEENVELIAFIVPVLVAHAVCNMSTCLLLPIGLLFFETKIPPTIYFDFIPFYYVLLPMLLYFKSERNSRREKRWVKIQSCENDPSAIHHQQLQMMFNSTKKHSLTKIKVPKRAVLEKVQSDRMPQKDNCITYA